MTVSQKIIDMFDADFYRAKYQDAGSTAAEALDHFLSVGLSENRDPNAFFDVSSYLASNADVAEAGVSAVAHYAEFGMSEGRTLSGFDEAAYLAANEDVAAAVLAGDFSSGLQHALNFGLDENRSGLDNPVNTGVFQYGVASGDPDATSVVLWTHARPFGVTGTVEATWQVATDENFTNIVSSGTTYGYEHRDHTVKTIAFGLEPGTEYFYRFLVDGQSSEIGQTKTLETGALDELNLAVFSCANFGAGYFNAYGAAVEDGFDYSVHLGDFLYEYAPGYYADQSAADLGRVVTPNKELVTQSDYSTRYAQYMTDENLQALRKAAPMIMMWDDHEIANDSWATGAENHSAADEGSWSDRVDAALEAYYFWNPVRVPVGSDLKNHDQSYTFGDLATLHMMETRLQARDETRGDILSAASAKVAAYSADPTAFALDVASFPSLLPEGIDPNDPASLALLAQNATYVGLLAVTALSAEAASPERDMIGDEQLEEVSGRIIASDATWQILGSQTLMNEMKLPAGLLLDATTFPIFESALTKIALGQSLTAEESALVNGQKLSYNFDSWDGYAAEREALLNVLTANDKNGIVIAGDTHNAWSGQINTIDGTPAAYHFATPGVTAPGLEAYFSAFDPETVAQLFTYFNDSVSYANTKDRGYLDLTITSDLVDGTFVYVDTVLSEEYTTTSVSQTGSIDLFA